MGARTFLCAVSIFAALFRLSAAGTDPPLIIDDRNPSPGTACLWDSHRPDSHAPIGVMADHTHHTGKWMASYRYMFMDMRPNYTGNDTVGLAAIQGPPNGTTFPIIPTNMQTQMHMAGLMFAPNARLTLTGMIGQSDKAMDHNFIAGPSFRTHTHGLTDFRFGGLLKIYDDCSQRVHLNLLASAPTGSITETGFLPPLGAVARLPYPMQLGSGTWDLLPGITWLGQSGRFSWGSQLNGTLRLHENDVGYTLGDEIALQGWTAYQLSDRLSASIRAVGKHWGDIAGGDALLNPLAVPTARPDLRGGQRIDLFGGLNYLFTRGWLKGHRLAAEAGGTVWQDLHGPQLGMDWMVTVGWQKAF